jgi:hypothetical protein
MINAYNNLQKNQNLSYNHKSKMINEYNNPNIIPCMFPTLFPFGFGLLEMANKVVKVSQQLHVKQIFNLDETKYTFSNTIYSHSYI